MSFKDQTRRRRAAEKRGRRGNRRASAMLLKQAQKSFGLHPVVIGVDLGSGDDMCVAAYLDEAGTIQIVPDAD